MQTEPRLAARDELALVQWRNSCELWKRQCAEPEAEGAFECQEIAPYLLVLQRDASPLPHLARLEQNVPPDIERFGLMYSHASEDPVEAALSLRLHPEADIDSWRQFLGDLGFQSSAARHVAMGRNLADVRASQETDVQVSRVQSDDEIQLAQAMECNGEAFGSSPSHRRFFLNPRTVDVYLALYEGIAAGSATAAFVGDSVGVYGVATRPGFRGRGVAGALVSKILADAAGRASVAVLDCQQELVALYQRSGFEVVRDMPTFLLLAARR